MSRFDHAKNYLLIAACALLAGVNIAAFLFFPGLLHPVAIVLSNVITMVVTGLAFKPISHLLDDEAQARQKELARKLEQQKALELKVGRLEIENKELASRLDTKEQAGNLPSAIHYTFKLEQMEFAKKGYIVKEDSLDNLDPEKYRLPELSWWKVFLGESGEKKIQYIRKFYYKVAIGLDFTKIRYRLDAGKVLFSGVRFTKLHDISSELVKDEGDIDSCQILKVDGDRTDILHDKAFSGIKKTYCDEQERSVKESLASEAGTLCQLYSDVFRESIIRMHPNVEFVDEIEESDKGWSVLNGTTDRLVAQVASNMLMLTSVIGKAQAIEESTLNQLAY